MFVGANLGIEDTLTGVRSLDYARDDEDEMGLDRDWITHYTT